MGKIKLGGKAPKLSSKGEDAAVAAKQKLKQALPRDPLGLNGPSPNPATNLLIADLALRSTTMLASRAVQRRLLGTKYPTRKAAAILRGRTLRESMFHTLVARVATRSVPGAIIVGGGLLAKTLFDRAKGRQAKHEGDEKLQEMARDGEE